MIQACRARGKEHTFWGMLGPCLTYAWDVVGTYLGYAWGMFGTCLGYVLELVLTAISILTQRQRRTHFHNASHPTARTRAQSVARAVEYN